MKINFHYYVTYTAAVKAGFSEADAAVVARAAQYVDECYDVTVQSNMRLFFSKIADTLPFYYGQMRNILNIWPVFHFLPGNRARIQADVAPGFARPDEPRLFQAPGLICGTESHMTESIVNDAKAVWEDGSATQQQKLLRVGITMHVLADTFAHQGFAGIPLAEVNDVTEVRNQELIGTADGLMEKSFRLLENGPSFTSGSFGNLGHGKIGHLPDEPGCTFYYKAQWRKDDAPFVFRCNPLEFYCAYLMMIEAMQYIRGAKETFSNQVDRALLLDTRRGQWGETRRFVDMFNAASKDESLMSPWFCLVSDVAVPEAYDSYDGSRDRDSAALTDFIGMAMAFRKCVFDHCTLLRDYYELYK